MFRKRGVGIGRSSNISQSFLPYTVKSASLDVPRASKIYLNKRFIQLTGYDFTIKKQHPIRTSSRLT